MTAKQQAIKDIKEDCKKSKRVFVAFRSNLNKVMNSIVSEYLTAQEYAKVKKGGSSI